MTTASMIHKNPLTESALRTWGKLCAAMCSPDSIQSLFQSAPMTPAYMLRMQQAQLGFLLHLQKTSPLSSGAWETFWLLLFIKTWHGPSNGNGSAASAPPTE